MKGKKSSYDYGSVHATTDLAVFSDEFETTASVLWLVENRGVLTRMAYEHDFLVETNSFVLGIDGQVRSAHRHLVENLSSCVKQVIIWSDVDEAGLTIEMARLAYTHIEARHRQSFYSFTDKKGNE